MSEMNKDEVAYSGVMELKGAEDSHRAGLKVKLVLGEEKHYEYFKQATKRRAQAKKSGKAGIVYRMAIRPDGEDESWRMLEAWLLGWSMSHNQGAQVAFELSDYDDFQYFRQAPARDDSDTPASYQVVLWELDDQGRVVNQKARAMAEEAYERPKGGRRSIHAARLQNDLDFQVYVAKMMRIEAPATPDQCADFTRQQAGVESRALLDHNESAWRRFHLNVESPFVRWRESRTGQGAIAKIQEKMGETA